MTHHRENAPLILVVDDDAVVRLLAREALEQEGFLVAEAVDGRAAMLEFERIRPAALLLDVSMPELDGYGVCRRVRALPQGRHVPVLMATAYDDIASIRAAYDSGATDFITKPIHWPLLGYRIHYLLRASQAIREWQEQDVRIRRLAYYDELTALPNRNLFVEHLRRCLSQALAHGRSVALLCLDLDHFKNVNDSLGHSQGDELIRGVAERLLSCVREGDFVARMGGDEFMVVLAGREMNQAATDAAAVADAIHQSLSRPFLLQDHELVPSASIGIALHPHDAGNAEDLVKHADTAMYGAKELGRNTCQFFKREMNLHGLRRLTLEGAMRHALERGEFELYFQPQYCYARGCITGAETLLRWHNPEQGTISPAEFIPLAEDTGLIRAIGEWVLETACAAKRDWSRAGLCGTEFGRIAVNVSARQIWHPDFSSRVIAMLERVGMECASGLELELTESSLLRQTEEIQHTFRTLKDLGINFALDDFGTGYSSLSYLKRFPLDILKIDQSFVRDCTDDPGDAAIVRAIIAMAHGLGLEVIAEGVETDGQVAFLAGHGCRLMQGYRFGRPLPKAEFEQLLRAQSRADVIRPKPFASPPPSG